MRKYFSAKILLLILVGADRSLDREETQTLYDLSEVFEKHCFLVQQPERFHCYKCLYF